MPAPTDRQLNFLADLLIECHPGQSLGEWTTDAQRLNRYSAAHASLCIDQMTNHRASLRQRRATARQSAFASGVLQSASAAVEGLTESTRRLSTSMTTAAQQIASRLAAQLDGIHIIDDHAYRVGTLPRRRHERSLDVNDPSRRRFVWRLVIVGSRARWVRMGQYRPSMTCSGSPLSLDTLATLDGARTFGQAFGFCVNCGRTLVVQQSIERSLGPVCYRRIVAQSDRAASARLDAIDEQRAARSSDDIMDAEIVDDVGATWTPIESRPFAIDAEGNVQGYLVQTGTFVQLDAGEIDLGIVRNV